MLMTFGIKNRGSSKFHDKKILISHTDYKIINNGFLIHKLEKLEILNL